MALVLPSSGNGINYMYKKEKESDQELVYD